MRGQCFARAAFWVLLYYKQSKLIYLICTFIYDQFCPRGLFPANIRHCIRLSVDVGCCMVCVLQVYYMYALRVDTPIQREATVNVIMQAGF